MNQDIQSLYQFILQQMVATPIWKTLAPYLTNRSRMRSFKETIDAFQIQSLAA